MTTNTTTPPTIPAGPKPVGATNTGLDLLVTTITDDPGLTKKIPLTDIYSGATAADGMNRSPVRFGASVSSAIDGSAQRCGSRFVS